MRREIKYLVREADRHRLYDLVGPYLRPDRHASGPERPSYTVRSIYFDTPGLRDYTEKTSGDQQRQKVRVRGYDRPGGDVFLEIKRKHGAAVWKDRAALPPETVAALLTGAASEAFVPSSAADAARRFLFLLRRDGRRPALLVTYDREPLIGRFDPSLRVTLDRRLRCALSPTLDPDLAGLYRDHDLTPVFLDHFILEVKYDRTFPSWLRGVTARLGLRRQALSKYTLGLEHESRATPWRFGIPAVLAHTRPVR